MTLAEQAYDQLKTLPEDQAQEVLDFIGYLRMKNQRVEGRNVVVAQDKILGRVRGRSEIRAEHETAIHGKRNLADLRGMLKYDGPPISIEELCKPVELRPEEWEDRPG